MHPRQRPPEALIRLAAAQSGVASREHALGLGLTRPVIQRLVDEQRWRRLSPGIFLTGGEPSWQAAAWGAVLIGGDRARLGGRAAAHLAGILDEQPDDILVWVPAAGHIPLRQAAPVFGVTFSWVFRRDRQGLRGTASTGRPPRIASTDLVLDLAQRSSDSEAIALISTAVGRRLGSPQQLGRALRRRSAVPNRRFLTAVLEDVADGAHSSMELRYVRDVERAHR